MGVKCKNFKNYDKYGGPTWLCFTIYGAHRAISIECDSIAQVSHWVFSLQNLIPISSFHLNRLNFIRTRLYLRVSQIAYRLRVSIRRVCSMLYKEALAFKNELDTHFEFCVYERKQEQSLLKTFTSLFS